MSRPLGIGALFVVAFGALGSACLVPDGGTNNAYSTHPAPSPTLVIPDGSKVAKIIFLEGARGSFDSYTGGGTPTVAGSGHAAVRFFDGANNEISKPGWLPRVEIGITGSGNTHTDAGPVTVSSHPNCARFGNVNDANRAKCTSVVGGVTTSFKCVPDGNYFRISEWDCVVSGAHVNPGTGSSSDQVYVRAYFSSSSSYLGLSENIMAVIEYQAAGLKTGEVDPNTCYNAGAFTEANCSDPVWQAFIKAGDSGTPHPLSVLIPPSFNYSKAASRGDSYGLVTRQIMIPMASYRSTGSDITVFQLTRKGSNYTDGSAFFKATCGYDSTGTTEYGNSPLCVGVVIRSIQFMRI